MSPETPKCDPKVEVSMDEEGKAEVSVLSPGQAEVVKVPFDALMDFPNLTPEVKVIKIKACKKYNRLNKERRARIAVMRSPSFEIVRVESDLSPYTDDFDPTRDFTICYKLDGVECRDTLSSLSARIRASPEAFPPDIVLVVRRAVRDKLGGIL